MSVKLPIIVLAQFFCTSLWFAGNAIMPELLHQFKLPVDFLAHLTSAVQLGFITGTLVFAVFTVADRFSPSRIFCICALLAAFLNLGLSSDLLSVPGLLLVRLFTGFCLAGIYPVGMKIAADYHQKGLGKALGFLVGALVLGTAFPHLLKVISKEVPVYVVIYGTSGLSLVGGLAMVRWVPDGPFRKKSQQLNITAFLKVFKNKPFRSAALGYFGHMWELYAFWVFVPLMLTNYNRVFPEANLPVPLLSFCIIAVGAMSCVISGLLSQRYNTQRVAGLSLGLSGICCMLSPIFLWCNSTAGLVIFLLFWGMVVVADSPLFSSLVAQHAPEENRGTSITIVNCLGFAITILSIQFLNALLPFIKTQYLFVFLMIGPVGGLIGLYTRIANQKKHS